MNCAGEFFDAVHEDAFVALSGFFDGHVVLLLEGAELLEFGIGWIVSIIRFIIVTRVVVRRNRNSNI